jgi:tRNA-2-methylthio-N6-dimethylallyladenosine synthase
MVEKIRFDSAFMFIYSKRSGTAAAEMEDQVSSETKHERIQRLIRLQTDITFEKNKARVGQTFNVLVESESRDKRLLCGRNDAGFMINFPGDPSLIGSFAKVRIAEASPHTLTGELVQS